MISMLLLNNFKLMSGRIKYLIEKELYTMGLCNSRDDFESRFIERNGNLSKLVVGSVLYGMGRIRAEYLILLMPEFKNKKLEFKLELHFIVYDVKMIKSYKEYNGYYGKQNEFEMDVNNFEKIVEVIRNKTENETPIMV